MCTTASMRKISQFMHTHTLAKCTHWRVPTQCRCKNKMLYVKMADNGDFYSSFGGIGIDPRQAVSTDSPLDLRTRAYNTCVGAGAKVSVWMVIHTL